MNSGCPHLPIGGDKCLSDASPTDIPGHSRERGCLWDCSRELSVVTSHPFTALSVDNSNHTQDWLQATFYGLKPCVTENVLGFYATEIARGMMKGRPNEEILDLLQA